jgi:acyl carrier protein
MGTYDEALAMITRWIETRLGLPAAEVVPGARLGFLGFDCLVAEELATAVETEFGVDVLDALIGEEATVGQVAEAVVSAAAGQRGPAGPAETRPDS